MANTDILELPVAVSISGTEQVPLVQGGVTRRVSASLLSDFPTTPEQVANVVLAGPVSGAAAAPSFRALVNADIPVALSITSLATSAAVSAGTSVAVGTSITAGTTITAAGVITGLSFVQTQTQTANTILAGPTTGAAAVPGYRALVTADIPSVLNITTLTVSGAANVGSLVSSGAVSGTTGTFSGAVSGTTGTFTGAVSATTGTFSGAVSGASLASAAGITGASATISGTVTAGLFSGSGASLTTSSVPLAAIGTSGAANTLLYNSALNTPGALATANSGVLITSGGGVPSISSTLPTAVQGNITQLGTLIAGTTSTVPLKFTSGTNLTAASAGSFEYDGTVEYFTPVATNRGVVCVDHFVSLSSNQGGSAQTALQPVFAGGGVTSITVPASTTYYFEGAYQITPASTVTLSLGFDGTATITSIRYTAITMTNTSGSTPTSALMTIGTVATAVAVTGGSSTTVGILVRGMVRINGAGTFIPSFGMSGTPNVTILANSYFRMWAAGSGSVLSVGQWT